MAVRHDNIIDEKTGQQLTQYTYAWWSEVDFEAEIVKMASFSITPDGEIIYRDGSEVAWPEIEVLANRHVKKKIGSKASRDIISYDDLLELIPDEEAAIDFVEEVLWDGVPVCPKCESTNTYMPASGKPMRHRCRDCKKYFSVKVGTPMEKTQLPLRTWIKAIHWMHTGRKGVSALQLHKTLGIAYQHAWHLEHRIRKAMETENMVMAGIVQVDETYIGGRDRWKHAKKKRSGQNKEKVPVMGFRDHTGRVTLFPITDSTRRTLERAIKDNVEPGSTVYTDGHSGYTRIPELGYNHEWVNHSSGEFVDGMATTNGIESHWALLKRAYVGTFHLMSEKHLHRYCSESAFRHNSGPGNGLKTIGRTLRAMAGKRLSWNELVDGPPE